MMSTSVEGDWIDDAAPAPAGYDRPRDAPPSPREEKIAARAGFVWISGRWDWKAGKWEWLADTTNERAGCDGARTDQRDACLRRGDHRRRRG
jgi:hypothetical protein